MKDDKVKVKLLVSRAGSDFSQSVDDIITVTKEEAMTMKRNGQCVIPANLNKELAIKQRKAEKAEK